MTNLDSIFKSRDITLPPKILLVKAVVFQVVLYGYESWTVKKAERRRIDAFELWFGEDSWKSHGLQGDPTSPTKGDQSWVFFGRNDAKAETPMLWPPEAKNQLNWKRPWCWERLKAGGEGDNRGWYGWMASPTWWIWVWASSGSWWWTGKLDLLQSTGSQRVEYDWATELNWCISTQQRSVR